MMENMRVQKFWSQAMKQRMEVLMEGTKHLEEGF